jgi:hypothetical protein
MSIAKSIRIGRLTPMSLTRLAEISRGPVTPELRECLWEIARLHHRITNARHALDFVGEHHTLSTSIVGQTKEKLDKEPCVIAERTGTRRLLEGPDGRTPTRPTSDRH